MYSSVISQLAVQESPIRWASRWDTYLVMHDEPIHWFSIVNSLMIVLFLTGMVAMIMLRTLHRDIAKYNQLESVDEAQEETGWKLVHGDVFRPPPHASHLATYVGTGVQLLGMSLVTMVRNVPALLLLVSVLVILLPRYPTNTPPTRNNQAQLQQ